MPRLLNLRAALWTPFEGCRQWALDRMEPNPAARVDPVLDWPRRRGEMSYVRFGLMILTSTVVMFVLMYLNTYGHAQR
jgi:hypothetical protein